MSTDKQDCNYPIGVSYILLESLTVGQVESVRNLQAQLDLTYGTLEHTKDPVVREYCLSKIAVLKEAISEMVDLHYFINKKIVERVREVCNKGDPK